MSKHFIKYKDKVSIQSLIVLSLIGILLFIIVAVYGMTLSYTRQMEAVTVRSMEEKVKDTLFSHISDYMEFAKRINELNALLAANGRLTLGEADLLGQFFLDVIMKNEEVDYLYYANREGGIVSTGRMQERYTISATPGMTAGEFVVTRVDGNGNPLEMTKRVTDFDPRTRAWYQKAQKEGESYWSEVYAGVSEPTLAITVSTPLINTKGEIIGVFGADILLERLAEILQAQDLGNGIAYLVDPDGFLIASSNPSQVLFTSVGNKLERVPAAWADFPADKGWGIFSDSLEKGISKELSGIYRLGQEDYHLAVNPYYHEGSQEMLGYLVIAVPEADLKSQSNTLFLQLTGFFAVLTGLSVFVVMGIARILVNPIKALNESAQHMSAGNWGAQIPTRRQDVLGQLTHSFNTMSLKIKEAYDSQICKNKELADLNANLEKIIRERTEELRTLSVTDALTGSFNHRYLKDFLRQKIEEARRYGISLAAVLLDIDFFKRVNDTHGHLVGNQVLIGVSECIKNGIRVTDVAGRYGGEEFLLILPYTSMEEAWQLADRLRRRIEESVFGDLGDIKITISGGVAACGEDTEDSLIDRADARMYMAKEQGRNRIVM